MSKSKKELLPKYVSLDGIALRLRSMNHYYRDAGHWSVGFKWKDGKLYSNHFNKFPNIHNKELLPISKHEWEEDNKGYINQSYNEQKDN